jgi:hypothetical protein
MSKFDKNVKMSKNVKMFLITSVELTIHTPIESPCRVWSKYDVFKIV